jgi:hypothetical protein
MKWRSGLISYTCIYVLRIQIVYRERDMCVYIYIYIYIYIPVAIVAELEQLLFRPPSSSCNQVDLHGVFESTMAFHRVAK